MNTLNYVVSFINLGSVPTVCETLEKAGLDCKVTYPKATQAIIEISSKHADIVLADEALYIGILIGQVQTACLK